MTKWEHNIFLSSDSMQFDRLSIWNLINYYNIELYKKVYNGISRGRITHDD